MESVKPAPSVTTAVPAPPSPPNPVPTAAPSTSIVAELFPREPPSSGGIFEAIFNAPSQRGMRRVTYASRPSSSELKRTPEDASSKNNVENSVVIIDKNPDLYSNEVAGHTFLGSSVYYGGRDDDVASSEYSRKSNDMSGENFSGGSSPRGNIWSGSYDY